MNKLLILLAALFLTTCNIRMPETRPNHLLFERMSEEELLAYNLSVPEQDQVFCTEAVGTGSHLRKRICMTQQERMDVASGASRTLNTTSSSTSWGQ